MCDSDFEEHNGEETTLQREMEPPQTSTFLQTPPSHQTSRIRRFFEEVYCYVDYYFERYFRTFAIIILVLVSFYLWYQFMIVANKPRDFKTNGTMEVEASSGTGGLTIWMCSSVVLIFVSFFISCI